MASDNLGRAFSAMALGFAGGYAGSYAETLKEGQKMTRQALIDDARATRAESLEMKKIKEQERIAKDVAATAREHEESMLYEREGLAQDRLAYQDELERGRIDYATQKAREEAEWSRGQISADTKAKIDAVVKLFPEDKQEEVRTRMLNNAAGIKQAKPLELTGEDRTRIMNSVTKEVTEELAADEKYQEMRDPGKKERYKRDLINARYQTRVASITGATTSSGPDFTKLKEVYESASDEDRQSILDQLANKPGVTKAQYDKFLKDVSGDKTTTTVEKPKSEEDRIVGMLESVDPMYKYNPSTGTDEATNPTYSALSEALMKIRKGKRTEEARGKKGRLRQSRLEQERKLGY